MSLLLSKPEIHYPYGRPEEDDAVLWRIDEKQYSYIRDAERDEYGVTDPILEARWYPILKRTPCGAWIENTDYMDSRDRRFIRLTANKRFACETVTDALESFIARKRRQAQIYRARLKTAEHSLALAEACHSLKRAEADPTMEPKP